MKMTKFQKNQISSIFEIWWHCLNWMKTHPLEFFWTPYHWVKHHNGKTPQPFVTHTDFCLFLRCFWTSSEYSLILVNTYWPKFSRLKIAATLLYNTFEDIPLFVQSCAISPFQITTFIYEVDETWWKNL